MRVIHRRDAVGRIVTRVQLAQKQRGAIVLPNHGCFAFRKIDGNLVSARNEIETVHGLIVLADVIVALGAAGVVVERHARADDIDERGPLMLDGGFDERHQLVLVTTETATDKGGTQLHRHQRQIDRRIAIHDAALGFRPLICGSRKLALGQTVDAIVLDDVGHVDAAPHHVRELAQSNRGGIAIAGNTEIKQLAIGQIGPRQYRGHAAMHGIESMRCTEKIVRRLGTATDAGQLGHTVRLNVELPAGLNDGCRNRVMPAARAQRRDTALIVPAGVAHLVLRQRGVVQVRLCNVGHTSSLRLVAATGGAEVSTLLRMALPMNRAVIGVPS